MTNTNRTGDLTFAAFEALYRETFTTMMRYTLKQVGSSIYCEKLADLADTYPDWAEIVEAKEGQ